MPLSPIVSATRGGMFKLGPAHDIGVPRILPMRSGSTFTGNGWIGIKQSTASVLRGVNALSLLGGLLGLLVMLGALTATWYREGR